MLAVPYGTPGYTARGLEMYARGSFRADDFVGLPVLYRHNEPIGHVRAAIERPDGIVVFTRMASTARAVEVAQLIADRAVSGVSVGFVEDAPPARSADGKRVAVTRATPLEVTVTPTQAYRSARVLGVNPGPPESTPTEGIAA